MWYSSSAYQTSPNGKLPVPHFASEKSSVIEAGRLSVEFTFETFATLALVLVLVFEFRLAIPEFAFLGFSLPLELVLEFEPMVASARIMTAAPTTTIPTTTIPPRIHQTALYSFTGVHR